MLTFLFLIAPLFADPTPDRPNQTQTAYLIDKGTLELEMGALWKKDSFKSPTTLKFGAGTIFEPRVNFNMGGIDSGDPDLSTEGKINLARESNFGISLGLISSIPTSNDDRWEGAVLGLFTAETRKATFKANLGLTMVGVDKGILFDGVPVRFLAGTYFNSSLSGFLEVGTVISSTFKDWLFATGLGWDITNIVTVDVGTGWDAEVESPFVTIGLTANLGRVGG